MSSVNTSSTTTVSSENIAKGFLFILPALLGGIALYVILWRMGFITSLVPFIIAYSAVTLYKKGAGSLSKKSAVLLLLAILATIIVAFISGIASDALDFYTNDAHVTWLSALSSSDYWNVLASNLLYNGSMWAGYGSDIAMALAFAALGSYGTIKDLFTLTTTKSISQ